jgi:hypothetical protein
LWSGGPLAVQRGGSPLVVANKVHPATAGRESRFASPSNREQSAFASSSRWTSLGRGGSRNRAELPTNPCRIESKAGSRSLAQPHDSKVVGMVVNEIATHAEAARDLSGID